MMNDGPIARMFMIGGPDPSQEEYVATNRPTALPEARVEHLREVFERLSGARFQAGDLVTLTRDSGLDPALVGEPHIVLMTRGVGAHECEWELTLYVATLDKKDDVVAGWVSVWQVEKYEPKKEE